MAHLRALQRSPIQGSDGPRPENCAERLPVSKLGQKLPVYLTAARTRNFSLATTLLAVLRSSALPVLISRDFDPVPTQPHTAPPASVLLAHIQKLHNTAFTLSHSAWLRIRQQPLGFAQQSSPKSVGHRCTANLPALHLSVLHGDCSAYGMREKSCIQIRKEGRTWLVAVFQPQHGLTQRLTKDQKLAQKRSRLRLATPDLEFILCLRYDRQAGYSQPAHECGRVRQHFLLLAAHHKPCVQQVQDRLIANHQKPVDPFLYGFRHRATANNNTFVESFVGVVVSKCSRAVALRRPPASNPNKEITQWHRERIRTIQV